jgi:hypothetical protein
VIVSIFINVLYIFENVVLFQRNNQLEGVMLVKDELIRKLRHSCMELIVKISELENFKLKSLRKTTLQSKSAQF